MSSAKKKTRLSAEERRAVILAAATETFLENGYGGARTKDIALRAGVNEALLYRHFASKEELFEQAVLSRLQRWIASQAADAATIAHTNEEARRELLLAAHEGLLTATVEVAQLLGVAVFAGTGFAEDFYGRVLVPVLDEWVSVVEKTAGQWTKPGIDMKFLLLAVWGAYVLIATDARLRGETVDVPRVANQMIELMLNGVTRRDP